jgi:opacity protein-like surface antigen
MNCARLVALVGAAAVVTQTAAAQRLEGALSTFTVQNHVHFSNATFEQTGQWFGLDGAVRFGRLRASAGVFFGSLRGSETDEALHPARDARATALALHGYALPWLAGGLQAEAKHFDSDFGPVVWRLIGANVLATPALGDALEGLADITYWPAATVIDGESMSMAFRALIGATYRVAPAVHVRLAYRFERFDFEGQGTSAPRLEQFRGATLGGVIRLR